MSARIKLLKKLIAFVAETIATGATPESFIDHTLTILHIWTLIFYMPDVKPLVTWMYNH